MPPRRRRPCGCERTSLSVSSSTTRLAVWAGIGALNLGDVTGMQRCYRLALEQARNLGAAGALPYALEHSAMNQAFAGEYAAARAAAEEGLRLASETGQQRSASQLLAVLAFIAGTTGDEASCLRLAEEARQIAVPRSLGLPSATATWALARLELVLGRFDQAVDRLAAWPPHARGSAIRPSPCGLRPIWSRRRPGPGVRTRRRRLPTGSASWRGSRGQPGAVAIATLVPGAARADRTRQRPDHRGRRVPRAATAPGRGPRPAVARRAAAPRPPAAGRPRAPPRRTRRVLRARRARCGRPRGGRAAGQR